MKWLILTVAIFFMEPHPIKPSEYKYIGGYEIISKPLKDLKPPLDTLSSRLKDLGETLEKL